MTQSLQWLSWWTQVPEEEDPHQKLRLHRKVRTSASKSKSYSASKFHIHGLGSGKSLETGNPGHQNTKQEWRTRQEPGWRGNVDAGCETLNSQSPSEGAYILHPACSAANELDSSSWCHSETRLLWWERSVSSNSHCPGRKGTLGSWSFPQFSPLLFMNLIPMTILQNAEISLGAGVGAKIQGSCLSRPAYISLNHTRWMYLWSHISSSLSCPMGEIQQEGWRELLTA